MLRLNRRQRQTSLSASLPPFQLAAPFVVLIGFLQPHHTRDPEAIFRGIHIAEEAMSDCGDCEDIERLAGVVAENATKLRNGSGEGVV